MIIFAFARSVGPPFLETVEDFHCEKNGSRHSQHLHANCGILRDCSIRETQRRGEDADAVNKSNSGVVEPYGKKATGRKERGLNGDSPARKLKRANRWVPAPVRNGE